MDLIVKAALEQGTPIAFLILLLGGLWRAWTMVYPDIKNFLIRQGDALEKIAAATQANATASAATTSRLDKLDSDVAELKLDMRGIYEHVAKEQPSLERKH